MYLEEPSITAITKCELLLFSLQATGSAVYAMIRTKLVPLIKINYDLCILTVLFSQASKNNQRSFAQPGRLANLCHLSLMPE